MPARQPEEAAVLGRTLQPGLLGEDLRLLREAEPPPVAHQPLPEGEDPGRRQRTVEQDEVVPAPAVAGDQEGREP